jgi:hypothetical protein
VRRWVAIAQPPTRRLQASTFQGHVGNVRDPPTIGALCREITLQAVRRRANFLGATGGDVELAPADAMQVRRFHETSHPLAPDMDAVRRQFGLDARSAIRALGTGMDGPIAFEQLRILLHTL